MQALQVRSGSDKRASEYDLPSPEQVHSVFAPKCRRAASWTSEPLVEINSRCVLLSRLEQLIMPSVAFGSLFAGAIVLVLTTVDALYSGRHGSPGNGLSSAARIKSLRPGEVPSAKSTGAAATWTYCTHSSPSRQRLRAQQRSNDPSTW